MLKTKWMGIASMLVGLLVACGGTDPAPAGDDDPCGDGVCSPGETLQSCQEDCDQCGDGMCDIGESAQNCAVDCPTSPPCNNNHVCDAGETPQSCAADCPPPAGCDGDGVCEANETAASCASDCNAKLRVQNSSSYTIFYLYVKRCTEAAWGPDQLGANVISPNQAFTLGGIPPGCWNFKANDSGFVHTWQSTAGVTLQPGATYTWTLLN